MITFSLNNKKITIIKDEQEKRSRLIYKALNGEIKGIQDYRELMEDPDYFEIYSSDFVNEFNSTFASNHKELTLTILEVDFNKRTLILEQDGDKISIEL